MPRSSAVTPNRGRPRTDPGAPPVLFADAAWLHRFAIDRLRRAGVQVAIAGPDLPSLDRGRAWTLSDVVVTNGTRLTADVLQCLPATGLVVRSGAGADIIDVEAATRLGIWVSNVPDYCADEVADHAVLLLLAAWRRLAEVARLWRLEGRWNVRDRLPPVRRIQGRRLGVVGFGRVGSGVARRAAAFGWRVAATDPHVPPTMLRAVNVRPLGLDDLFAWADAISLHCPLTSATHHLVDETRLARVRPGLVLVNTGRGALVDLDALEVALETGRVGAAALDVLDHEPLPDLAHPLLARPNVLVTPHVAWYSLESHRDLGAAIAEEVLAFRRGERPPRAVNPEARDAPRTVARRDADP